MSGTGKRHYEAMARVLKSHRQQTLRLATEVGLVGISKAKGIASLTAVLDDNVRFVASVFADDNDAFDYSRFLKAAGYGERA